MTSIQKHVMATALLNCAGIAGQSFKIVGNKAYVVTHQLSLIDSRGVHFDE